MSFLASVTVFMRRFKQVYLYSCVVSSNCNYIYASFLASLTVFMRRSSKCNCIFDVILTYFDDSSRSRGGGARCGARAGAAARPLGVQARDARGGPREGAGGQLCCAFSSVSGVHSFCTVIAKQSHNRVRGCSVSP